MKFIIIIIIIATYITGCSNKENIIVTGKEGQQLPNFNLLLMDSITRLNTQNIPNGKPFVIFMFNPYCAYCKAQTKEIIEDSTTLLDIQFYMLSTFPFEEIKSYYTKFHLVDYPNIIVAQDKDGIFNQYLNPPGVPCQAIYSRDKVLKQTFLGLVNTKVIKNLALE